MPRSARVGDFYLDTTCADYGKRQSQRRKNIVKRGKTKGVE